MLITAAETSVIDVSVNHAVNFKFSDPSNVSLCGNVKSRRRRHVLEE